MNNALAMMVDTPNFANAFNEGRESEQRNQMNALAMKSTHQQMGQRQQEAGRQQAEHMFKMLGSVGMHALGGDINGQPDAQRWNEGLDYLGQMGLDVEKYRGNPAMVRTAIDTSVSAIDRLRLVQDERQFQLLLQKADFDMEDANRRFALDAQKATQTTQKAPDVITLTGKDGDYQAQWDGQQWARISETKKPKASSAPSGFRWVDPANEQAGLEPIPGGPGTQISAELAARIGLAQDALTQLDDVETAAKKGEMTGVIDWAAGKAGRGDSGRYRRELAAGAEALTRMLTGAGMNIAEAEREADLYLPTIKDDGKTLANKVSQLKRRLKSTIEVAGRGRGLDTPSSQQADAGGVQPGHVEDGFRFKGGDPSDAANWEPAE